MTTEPTREFTPAAHSRLVGGSTAARRLSCPKSYQLEQELPPENRDESSSYADEGTALHECITTILTESIDDADTVIGRTFYGVEMTRKLVDDAIKPALSVFDGLLDTFEVEGGLAFVLEKSCAMPGIPEAFGTSDLIGRTDKRSVILDWKFGAGVPVAAYKFDSDGNKIGNPQLMFYARAAMTSHPELFETDPDWRVELYIVQPRIDESRGEKFTRFSTTVRELEEFRLRLIEAVEEMQGPNPRIAKGDHCNFARCKIVCPIWNGPQLDLSKMVVAQPLEIEKTSQMPDEEYAGLLGTILSLAEMVEPLKKEAQKQAHAWIEEGGAVPGWKLVAKKPGHDSWKDDDKVDAYLGRQGLDVNLRRVVKPITPAVARKLLKSIGKEINEDRYVAKGASSGSSLAAADDRRDEAITDRELAGQLSDKLGALIAR